MFKFKDFFKTERVYQLFCQFIDKCQGQIVVFTLILIKKLFSIKKVLALFLNISNDVFVKKK